MKSCKEKNSNLKMEVMGLRFKNPIVISAGPWNRGFDLMKKSLDSGAAAVVTESIVTEPYPDVCPRYAYNGLGMGNIRVYSGLSMEKWLDQLSGLTEEKGDGLVIANIMAGTPSELAYIGKKFEKAGVDGLELGLACPIGEGTEIIAGNIDKAWEYTKAVVDNVHIPVMVKLSENMNHLPQVVSQVTRAGASGITAIDAMRGILGMDINTRKPYLPAYAGYSGDGIRPIGLATVASIAQSTSLPVIGIGGISNYKHLLEYLMLGASLGGVGTAMMMEGHKVIGTILEELPRFMKENKIGDLKDIVGVGLEELRPLDELVVEPLKATLKEPCHEDGCQKCMDTCIEQAISFKEEGIVIEEERCSGCGICQWVCPKGILEMAWR